MLSIIASSPSTSHTIFMTVLIITAFAICPTQIVIDSVAALARKEGLNERDKELFFIHMVRGVWCVIRSLIYVNSRMMVNWHAELRYSSLPPQAAGLKRIAELCNCVVLATNQVCRLLCL